MPLFFCCVREFIQLHTSLATYGGRYMLQIKNLNITHLKDNRVLLQNLSFTLNAGDKAAIIGEEGNGKSTLLKLIYNETLVENYVDHTGEIIRNQARIGYLPQELSHEEKALSAYAFMCGNGDESLFLEADVAELSQISRQLKLPLEMFYSEQLLGQMSGGEKIKLQFARILVNKPDVLLLDEPFSALDAYLREQLQTQVHGILEQFGKDVLMVSHSRDEVYYLCDQVAVMHKGKILNHGKTKEVFANPRSKAAAVLTGCKNIADAYKTGDYEVYVIEE